MSDCRGSEINLDDVYFLAQNIAEEFEKVAQNHDIEVFRSAVEKVIQALEILECTVKRNGGLKIQLADALSENMHLSFMKEACFHERALLKESFEEAEESWLQEVSNLKTEISLLKSENENLKRFIVIEKENEQVARLQEIIKDLESAVHKLHCSLCQKEKDLQNLITSENNLNDQLKKLAEKNEDLRFKNDKAKQNIDHLRVEKTNYKEKLQFFIKENTERKRENFQSSSVDQRIECSFDSGVSCEESLRREIRHHIKIELKLLEKIKFLQSQLDRDQFKSKENKNDMFLKPVSESENKFQFENAKIYQLYSTWLMHQT